MNDYVRGFDDGRDFTLAEIEEWIKKSQEPNYTMEALSRLMAHLKTGKKDLGKTQRILALTAPGGVIGLALADQFKAMALIDRDGAGIAHPHLQPQDARRFANSPQTRGVRADRKAEADRIAREQAEAARAAKDAGFRAENAQFIAKLAALDGEFWDGFWESFLTRATAPTERQVGLVEAEIAKRAQNAASGHLGAVGDKLTMTITVERIIVLESKFYGNSYITIARDEQGNIISYKGLTDIGNKGDTLTIKATVKEHTVYKGVKQTVIQRPKVLEEALG